MLFGYHLRLASVSKKKVVVLGTGYWGLNLVRNFHEIGVLAGVCDTNPAQALSISKKFGNVPVFSGVDDVLSDATIDGVVIATPASTHHDLAKRALIAGKDVLVEKPLSLRLSQARELLEIARAKSRVLMVGHLLRYHPALIALKKLIDEGHLGKIEYLYSNRLNLGKIRTEENILWSFAPHDVSAMLWMLDALPIQVNVVGGSYLQPNVTDTTVSTFSFDHGIRGHIFVSWLHPFKEQRLVVVGSKKMAVFNDQAEAGKKLMLYDKSVEKIGNEFIATKPDVQFVGYDSALEPLRAECVHFVSCMETRQLPRTDGEEGLAVLKVLQACQRSLQMNGQPVQVADAD